MFNLIHKNDNSNLVDSRLYDQKTFYKAFMRDLTNCHKNLVIECPFITAKRMNIMLPILDRLRRRNVNIVINTRNPDNHEDRYHKQAHEAISSMQTIGITVLYTVGHHRKLAIIDKQTIWEGSLNILSFNDSCEIMRRITSIVIAKQLLSFTGLNKYL